MTRMHARIAAVGAIVMLVAAMSAARVAAQAKVDVTGKWAFSVETSAGAGSPTFTFKQDGEKLTGHYTGTFGEAEVTGTIKGADITFSSPPMPRAPRSRDLHRHRRQGHDEGQARHRRVWRRHLHGEETMTVERSGVRRWSSGIRRSALSRWRLS